MKYNTDDKRYLDKLRRDNPNRDIPSDIIVEMVLSTMPFDGSESLEDDLIIRTWDGIVEFELI